MPNKVHRRVLNPAAKLPPPKRYIYLPVEQPWPPATLPPSPSASNARLPSKSEEPSASRDLSPPPPAPLEPEPSRDRGDPCGDSPREQSPSAPAPAPAPAPASRPFAIPAKKRKRTAAEPLRCEDASDAPRAPADPSLIVSARFPPASHPARAAEAVSDLPSAKRKSRKQDVLVSSSSEGEGRSAARRKSGDTEKRLADGDGLSCSRNSGRNSESTDGEKLYVEKASDYDVARCCPNGLGPRVDCSTRDGRTKFLGSKGVGSRRVLIHGASYGFINPARLTLFYRPKYRPSDAAQTAHRARPSLTVVPSKPRCSSRDRTEPPPENDAHFISDDCTSARAESKADTFSSTRDSDAPRSSSAKRSHRAADDAASRRDRRHRSRCALRPCVDAVTVVRSEVELYLPCE
ncbi:hypothetical protein BDK51DRAFT_53017 [Blyttiomyces helicus]|uniref:Uncharacterized protein n=1 Tax=Blyttiomyces helicus TaxID=388810 RepID=A0A4P9W466_9FUNG|nr:hypothetical protein BDK51DRAFT_53017 [Blyttiomyces helicus]|eukprot:RKO86672.1 hypothetical protein BDK51DRAFT_53017 [Blyttiomyces helicus]